MEPQERPPPLVALDQNTALQCAEFVEFLSEDSTSCDAHELGKRTRGIVEPQASRKKDKRETGIQIKDVSVSGESRISCGQHVKFQVLLESSDLRGKYFFKSLSPKEEEKYFPGRQVLAFFVMPENPTTQRFLLGIELWFKQIKDTTETRIDDFCAKCKKKSTKKKLLTAQDDKKVGIFGEKMLLEVHINDQCSHFEESFGGPAKSEFFLNTILGTVEDQKAFAPTQKKMSSKILVIAAGKASDASSKKAEKSVQAMKVVKDIVTKFEESLRQLHMKVDAMDQRLSYVETSIQNFIVIPKIEPMDSPRHYQQQTATPPLATPMATPSTICSITASSISEFKFQKFGTGTSPTASTVQSPAFSLFPTENSAIIGGEQIISENSFAAQIFNSENSKLLIKPDPELLTNSTGPTWSDLYPAHAAQFVNPSL